MGARSALIAGSTGLVGGRCLPILLGSPDYARVTSIGRRRAARDHAKLQQLLIDFDRLADAELPQVDDVYCSLGARLLSRTTLFEKVDLAYPVELAKRALEAGAKTFVLVTSVATDPRSSLPYLRVKAEVEERIRGLGFERCYLVRPGFVIGTPAEGLMTWAAGGMASLATPVLVGHRRIYRPIRADALAAGMVGAGLHGEPGTHVLHRDELRELATLLP